MTGWLRFMCCTHIAWTFTWLLYEGWFGLITFIIWSFNGWGGKAIAFVICKFFLIVSGGWRAFVRTVSSSLQFTVRTEGMIINLKILFLFLLKIKKSWVFRMFFWLL